MTAQPDHMRRAARHEAATTTKRTFLSSLTTLFPSMPRKTVATCWTDLCGELALEEISDIAGPLARAAARVHKAREDRPHGRL